MLPKLIFKLLILIGLSFPSLVLGERGIPQLTSPIVDEVGVIGPRLKKSLSNSLYSLKKNAGPQFQVLIISSLHDENIESYSIRVVEKWKLGNKGRDDGALLLISIDDRKMRIEVGDGLEGSLTDLQSGRIIDSMKPFFRKADFEMGVYVGLHGMASAVGVDLGHIKMNKSSRPRRLSKRDLTINAIAFIIFFFIIIIRFRFNRYSYYGSNSSWSGGGSFSSGSSWSGGGGGFSGGGASGAW